LKTKHDEKGEVTKHKSLSMIQGYTQEYGVDDMKVFTLVIHMETI